MNSSIKTISILLEILAIFGVSCSQTNGLRKDNGEEVMIEKQFMQFDSDSNQKPLFEINEKVWFKDSMAIEEVKYLDIVTSQGVDSKQVLISHYRFINLKEKRVWEYLNFSDTAAVQKTYSYQDSAIQLSGGWNFLYKRKWDYNGEIIRVADTTIDNVLYKRAIINRGTPELPYVMDCYFRCDIKTKVFTHDPFLSDIIGCPLVRINHYSPVKKGLHIFSDIRFLSKQFTSSDAKVFKAWAKQAQL